MEYFKKPVKIWHISRQSSAANFNAAVVLGHSVCCSHLVSMWMRLGSTGVESSFFTAAAALLGGTALGTADAIISSGGFGCVRVNGSSTERSLSRTNTSPCAVWKALVLTRLVDITLFRNVPLLTQRTKEIIYQQMCKHWAILKLLNFLFCLSWPWGSLENVCWRSERRYVNYING